MIKINIESKEYTFDKETIIIGDGPADSVDICFPSEGLHKNHIKITLRDKDYWIFNQANDPFASLNQQPFWKKKLQQGDHVQLRGHSLIIQQISFETKSLAPEPPKDSPVIVKNVIEEAYNLEEHKQMRPLPKVSKVKKPINGKKIFKLALLLTLLVFSAMSLIFAEMYFRTLNQMDREEMLAAESISDYAMALQYAKVYHIAPQKQSWVDPQFLKNNLIDLLSTTSLPCGNIDAQGQFSNCPYILRFYTNRDFSRFLLIAQPDATLSQVILPKKTLIVDSSLMEVRKTSDLKTLNRLLSYPTPLDGANGEEVKRAILQTEVIPLDTLAKEIGKPDFSPPIALSYMKPGAENLIYNAPRYHQFGETFLKKALFLTEGKNNSYETSILQSELESFARFHDLIFYSSNGMKEAFKGYLALQRLVLPSNFFTGYLLYSKEGKIINSRLVINSETNGPRIEEPQEEIAEASSPKLEIVSDDEMLIANLLREQVEAAQEEIGPIIHNIYLILEDIIEKDSLFLPSSIQQLIDLYRIKHQLVQESIKKTLEDFRKTNPNIEDVMINRLLREYGLLDFYYSELGQEEEHALSISNWEALQNLISLGREKTAPTTNGYLGKNNQINIDSERL